MHKASIFLAVFIFIIAAIGTYLCFFNTVTLSNTEADTLQEGCSWKLFQDTHLGIRMPIQVCTGNNYPEYAQPHFSAQGNSIYLFYGTSTPSSGYQAIQTFSKPADQSITQAITSQFISPLPNAYNKTCIVGMDINSYSHPDCATTTTHYDIQPNDLRKKSLDTQAGTNDIPDYSECGYYALDPDTISYFEYHPNESRTRFIFVHAGQDTPPFDQDHIEIFDPQEWSLRSVLYPIAHVRVPANIPNQHNDLNVGTCNASRNAL